MQAEALVLQPGGMGWGLGGRGKQPGFEADNSHLI